MSFPRAKIQRFNDVMNSVPSPTKYDPKLSDKVIGGCILKGEAKSSTFSDTASASSSKSNHTPVFRTPQLPKKHNCLGVEKGSQSAFKSISLKCDDIEFLNNEGEIEELKSLRVECSNKSETINDLEKHVQDLKTQLCNHEKAKEKLEAYIVELEKAKSNLECIKSNNDNYEQQIKEFQMQMLEMKLEKEELIKNKENILVKLEEVEKINNKLEDSNLDYERKLISFEGTIEHLEMENTNKNKLLAEVKQKEEINKMNYQVSLDCLKGKISTLENEIKGLNLNKSKNEATIFGLETQISNLNVIIEKMKNEISEYESLLKELKSKKEELDASCRSKDNIILDLEIELGTCIKSTQEIKEINENLLKEIDQMKTVMEEEKLTFKCKLNEISENAELKIKELNAKIEEQEASTEIIKKDFEAKKLALIKSHMEEVLQLQNEYESKLLSQMQDNTEKINNFQCQLDEKENSLKQANLKYVKACSEWENKFQESENNFSNIISNLQSEQLEVIEETKNNYIKKIKILESNSCKFIDQKNKEIDVLTIQYKEILHEVNYLLSDLEKKDEEIKSFQECNKNLNSRLKLMLEEIKLLNKENEEQVTKLDEMTTKYKQEFNKNEKLSCTLGERDTEILHLKDDLSRKTKEWQNLFEELKKSNNLCDKLQIKKSDLENTIGELNNKSNKLLRDLNERKTIHKEEVKTLKQELTDVKSQCRKFEIIMGNTSKSLEALRQRLMESENEVVKLGNENSVLKKELEEANKLKNEYQNENDILKESKLDLETTLDENLSINKNLLQKCANLELLSNDYELKIKHLTKTNEDLEAEKQNYIQMMNELIKKQELQLIEIERASINQIEEISQTLSEKLEFFLKFSTEKIHNLTAEIKKVKSENENLKNSLLSKTEDFDNLFTDYEILKTTVDISVKEIENLKKKCEDQAVELKEKENLTKDLIFKKEELEQSLSDKLKEHFKMVEKCEVVQKELDETKNELKKMNKCSNDLSDQVNNLESEIINLEAIINQKTEKLQKMEKEIIIFENKIQEKNDELLSCEDEKIKCVEKVQNLTKEKENLINNISSLEKKLKDADKLTEDLRRTKQLAEEKCLNQKIELEQLSVVKCELESEVLNSNAEIELLKNKESSLEEVQSKKNYYKNNCLRLDKLCQELTEENSSLKNDFNEIHSFLQIKDKKIEELEKRSTELESLIGPFREQLERYETERLLIENDREQLRKQHLEQAAELGHRNHKQKIQHVVNLKNTLLQTRKENEKLTLEIKNLKKKMQKLQEELGHDPKRLFIGGKRPTATPFKGKENSSLLSPAAGFYQPIAVKQEPMSPSSPLRNRNQ